MIEFHVYIVELYSISISTIRTNALLLFIHSSSYLQFYHWTSLNAQIKGMAAEISLPFLNRD